MAITIKDVARESGVNISTVSRALNNGYGVNGKTRNHVIAVAARLNEQTDDLKPGRVSQLGKAARRDLNLHAAECNHIQCSLQL